jgi:hypothetical protein
MDEACNEAFKERREELLLLLRNTHDDEAPLIQPKSKKNNQNIA